MRVSNPKFISKVPQYYHLKTKETESKPIVWDVGEEEEEHPFVNNYEFFENNEDSRTSLFQEGEKGGYDDNVSWDMLVEEEMLEEDSLPVDDTDNEERDVIFEDDSDPIYDTDHEEKEDISEDELDPIYDTDTDEEEKSKDEEFLYGDR